MASHFKGPVLHNDTVGTWTAKLPVAQDPDYVVYFNDFLSTADYAATDWTITTTEDGAGSATEAIATDELGGALLITNDDADDDADSLQMNEEVWKLSSGKRLWYKTRMKLSDATQSDLFVGLCITDTTPLVATDRIGFEKNDGDALLDALCELNSTETNTASVATAADDTYVELGFYWDGKNKVEYFVNDALVATHTSNIPSDENLAVTIHLVNGEAAAKTATVDYIYVAMER